jgi:hypothetical protein
MRLVDIKRITSEKLRELMGSVEGGRYLSKYHGYRHEPTKTQKNRWVLEL